MDPYCIVEMSGQKFKTKAKTDAGKNPTWNERFLMLNVTPAYSTELQLSVWDSNTVSTASCAGSLQPCPAQPCCSLPVCLRWCFPPSAFRALLS